MEKLQQVLDAYVKMLNAEDELEKNYRLELETIRENKKKVEEFLLKRNDIEELPEEIFEKSPFLAWQVLPKTDESVIRAYMKIRDGVIPKVKNQAKEIIEPFEEQKSHLESWTLKTLNDRGSTNFSVKNLGRASTRTDHKYTIQNKKDFVNWAVQEGCEEELTITLRPNSKFVANIVDETGELPPAVSSFKEKKVVFTKS